MGELTELRAQQSPLRNPRFIGFIVVGCLGFGLVHRFVPVLVQITAIAAMVMVLACLVAAALEQQAESHQHIELMFEQLEIPLCLAPEHQLYDEFCEFARAFRDLAAQSELKNVCINR